ncbi:MAG: GNAT family N-acetyltransferase [Planctomycetia bacterium]
MSSTVLLDYALLDSIADIDDTAWNRCAGANPYLQHAFFLALERTGSVGPALGVVPKYLVLRTRPGEVVACAPAMLKTGTWREYGPEHGWLNTAAATGWFAWPKFQVGIPLHPVPGPKLLVRPGMPLDVVHKAFVDVLLTIADRWKLARVVNVMQVDAATAAALARHGALVSHELRSVWHNPGHATFDEYLATLPSRKRRQALVDGRRFSRLGLEVRVLHGHEITPPLIHDFYEGFRRVCTRHGSPAWLPEAMFHELVAVMPGAVVLQAAFESGRFVAGGFGLRDGQSLYRLPWSAMSSVRDLAIDLICHRPKAYAIEHGLARIDAGVAAPHKTCRGYADEPAFNAHWFLDERMRGFAQAVMTRVAMIRAKGPAMLTT